MNSSYNRTDATNSSNIDTNLDIFDPIFDDLTSKALFMTSTFVIDAIFIFLSYGTIWFERRTLKNKLMVSTFMTASVLVPVIQLSELPRYFLGPQPATFCLLQSVIKNSLKWQLLLLLDSVIIVRYIFIFWLKNPGAVNEDFWTTFANGQVIGISLVTNFVIFFLPGRKPLHFYICAGLDPTSDYKLSHSSGFIEFFSLILHLLIKVKISWYKHNKVETDAGQNSTTEKQSLADFTTHMIFIIVFLAYALLNIKTNSLTLEEVNKFPNYLYIYALQLLGPSLLGLTIVVVQYIRNSEMRQCLVKEFKSYIDCNE